MSDIFYGLYGLLALLILGFLFNGTPDFWDALMERRSDFIAEQVDAP